MHDAMEKEGLTGRLMTGSLETEIYADRRSMGRAAAADIAACIRSMVLTKPVVHMVFAAAPSQSEMLEALCLEQDVAWDRVIAFHMDEYIGLPVDAPQLFAHFLDNAVFGRLPFRQVHLIRGGTSDPASECGRYASLLRTYPTDIVCMGIGENTHIAFNDPHVADFSDPYLVKIVELDEVSRRQQVHDGCFPDLSAVPVQAITLTVPALLKAERIFCVVPGPTKAEAVFHTLKSEVSVRYPSTCLRGHPSARMYLDRLSAAML
jgi:glucosamine-6-phosphate deaminase